MTWKVLSMVAVASIAALLHYEMEEDILYVAKEVVVPVTRAKAFLFIADMSNYRRWHVGIDDFVPVDDSVMGIGKVFTETSYVAIYGNVSNACTVLGYEPPRFLSYTCDNWLTRPRIEIELNINEDNPRYPTSVFWREFSRRRSYFFNAGLCGPKEARIRWGEGRTNPFATARGDKMAMWPFIKIL